MGMLLAVAPFAVFFVLDGPLGAARALVAAALVSGALLARELPKAHRSFKVLEVGTFVLFVVLAIVASIDASLTIIDVRLCIDAGLLLIAVSSIVIRRPFTMQYAREHVSPDYGRSADFVKTSYVLTSTWALAFACLVAAEATLTFVAGFPKPAGIAVMIAAPLAALLFSIWYSKRARARFAAASP